ncbi:MAG TPA: GNAT family N-acetyltransferase [Candidatus Avanaerovorax faecigallinarum]|nr:GNAT family N-acetyltransferase [Candidatus Avanaerovorax faecigallinarum]
MEVKRISCGEHLWTKAADFAEECSWAAGKHVAQLLRENRFGDGEAFFAAVEGGRILGYCTLLKEDYFSENRYTPWISSVFVTEEARGDKISFQMVETAVSYARSRGFREVYIPSETKGLYEKCGFREIDAMANLAGDMCVIYEREIL